MDAGINAIIPVPGFLFQGLTGCIIRGSPANLNRMTRLFPGSYYAEKFSLLERPLFEPVKMIVSSLQTIAYITALGRKFGVRGRSAQR